MQAEMEKPMQPMSESTKKLINRGIEILLMPGLIDEEAREVVSRIYEIGLLDGRADALEKQKEHLAALLAVA